MFLKGWNSQVKTCCKDPKFLQGALWRLIQIKFCDGRRNYNFLYGVTFDRISFDDNKCQITIFVEEIAEEFQRQPVPILPVIL